MGEIRQQLGLHGTEFPACSELQQYHVHGGGVEIGWLIQDMARNKETDREETKKCQGYEGSPKGRRRYRSCMNMFQIKAHVEYKDGALDNEEGKAT